MKRICSLFLTLHLIGCGSHSFQADVAVKVPEPLPPAVTAAPESTLPISFEESKSSEVPAMGEPTKEPQITKPSEATPPVEPKKPELQTPTPKEDPFVEIVKLGVNFEDRPNTDEDFNDAVLCFEGAFKINNTKLISTANQTISATTSSISLCRHRIEVKVYDLSGRLKSESVYDARHSGAVQIKLAEKDELEINMVPYEGCGAGQVRSMRDPAYAKILKNQCFTTGR